MDKKLLVSLMMTAPVSMFAAQWVGSGDGDLSYKILAEVNQNNWKANGVSTDYTTNAEGRLVLGTQTGFIYHEAALKAQGKYTLDATGLVVNAYFKVGTNAANAEIQYVKNDKGQYLDKNGNVTTKAEEYVYATKFDVVQSNAANTVYIEVCPVNKDLEFEVGALNLVFEFNFKTALDKLQAEYAKTVINQVAEDDNRADAKALRAEYITYSEKNADIEGWIDSIVLTDGDKLLTAYNTYHLGNFNTDFAKAGDDISNSIRSLQSTVGLLNATTGKYPAGSYNARVAAENEAWDNILTNRTNLAALEGKIAKLKADLAAKKNVANNISTTDAELKKFCQNALADELATAQADITALENAVKAKYPEDSEGNLPTTVVPSADFNTEAGRVSNYIAGISYDDAVADWTKYGDFLTLVKDLEKEYQTIFGNINDLYRISSYKINGKSYSVKNVYDDVTGDANNALADAYKQNDGYTYVNDKGVEVTVKIVERKAANYKDIIGARNWFNTVDGEITTRSEGMNAAETTLKDIYNDQEIALNGKSKYVDEPNPDNANTIISSLQTSLTGYENFRDSQAFQSLNATDQAKLKGFITDMQNALNKLCSTTNTEYLAHDLDVNGGQFAADKAAFDAKEQAYKDYLQNTVGELVVKLINLSNDLRAYVTAQTSTVKNSTLNVDYSSDLLDKFESSMDNIDKAIANYYGTKAADRTEKAYNDIVKGIQDVETACSTLVRGFNDALTELAKAQTANATFKNVLDHKVLIGDNGKGLFDKTPYETKQDGYATQIDGFKDQLKNIATNSKLNVQEAYEAANKTTEAVDNADLPNKIQAAQDEFVKAATQKNSDNVKKMLDQIDLYKTSTTEPSTEDPYSKYPGMSEVDLVEDIDGGYTSVLSSYTTEADKIDGAGSDVAKLGAIDNALKTIVDKCAGINAKIQNVLDNHSRYVSLNTTKDEIANTIRTYRSNVMTLTVNPAATHYIGLLGDLLTKLDDIKNGKTGYTGYETTYQAVKLTQTDPNLYQGYVNDLNDVKAEFEQLQKYLLENQNNMSDLMTISDALSVKINEDNGTLNDFDEVAYTDEYQDFVADLTTQLGNLNDAVTADFGEGKLIDLELVKEYKAKYQDLTDQLKAIIDEWTDGYHSAVVEANAEFLKKKYLGDNILNGQYTDAIAYVNDYLYKVYNVNFYPMLVNNETFIKNHNKLQENFKKIEKIDYQLNRFVDHITPANNTDPNSQQVLVPEKTYYGEINVTFENVTEKVTLQSLIDAAAEVNRSIYSCLVGIDGVGVEQAKAFWDANGKVAVDAWDDITSRLTAAGFTTEEIDDYYGTELTEISTIETVNAADVAALPGTAAENGQNAAAHKYILDMDAFAQMIDGLNAEVVRKAGYPLLPAYGDRDEEGVEEYVDGKVYTAVNNLWSSKSSDTQTKLNDLLDEIGDYEFDSAVGSYAANKQVITDALDKLADLSEDWNEMLDPARESTLPTNLAELETMLSDSEAAVASAKKNYDVYVTNQDVYKKVISNDGSVYNKAVNNIDDLLAWSGYRSSENINADEAVNSQKTDYDQLAVIAGLRSALETAKRNVIANISSETVTVTEASQSAIINAVGENQVNIAYGTIFNLEKKYANSMMVVLRSAFNTVNLMFESGDIDTVDKAQLDQWDALINALSTNITGLGYNANDREGCMNTLTDYEKVISELIVTIQGKAEGYYEKDTNTKQVTLDNLNNQFTEASTDVDNFISGVQNAKVWGEGTYTKPEQAKYEALANELQQVLDSYKSEYEADGDNVIQDAAKFSYMMNQLMSGEFAEITKGWHDAYYGTNRVKGAAAKDESDTCYKILDKTLDDLLSATNDAKDEAVDHEIDYSSIQYTNILKDIKGWTDKDGNFHNGLKQTYAQKAQGWNITSNDKIDSDLIDYVYSFVRNTLYNVANNERSNAMDKADYLMDAVRVPGVNENGWKLSFIDAEDIVSSILDDQIDLDHIDLTWMTCAILKYRTVVNNVVDYSDTNPDQAKEAYLSIMEQIKALDENMQKTYDDAVRDNLIVKGDVNDDKKVNILDVQKLITVVLDQEVYDAADKDSHIKDVNDDKDINVGDVTMLINWVIDGQKDGAVQAAPSRLAKFMKSFSGNNTFRVEEVVGENGYRRYAMLLTNETAFAAGQLNINLPSHAKVAGVHLGERADALDVYVQDNGDFTTVVMTSLDNSMIKGNTGCVLFIDVEGNAEPEVEKVIFSDIRGNAYNLSNATTGVDGIYESIKDGVKSIYNAAGQKLRNLSKGVNIIRNADGTTTKKIGK